MAMPASGINERWNDKLYKKWRKFCNVKDLSDCWNDWYMLMVLISGSSDQKTRSYVIEQLFPFWILLSVDFCWRSIVQIMYKIAAKKVLKCYFEALALFLLFLFKVILYSDDIYCLTQILNAWDRNQNNYFDICSVREVLTIFVTL